MQAALALHSPSSRGLPTFSSYIVRETEAQGPCQQAAGASLPLSLIHGCLAPASLDLRSEGGSGHTGWR